MIVPPRPSLRRQLRAAAVLLLIVGGILGGAWGAYRLTVGRPRLAGERSHEFEPALLVDGPVELSHTFELTNPGSSTIEIRDVRTTCGCTAAEPSTRSVGPGETLRIAATLTLKREGSKTSRIFLDYGDSDPDVLHLAGRARLAHRLSLVPGPARAVTGKLLDRMVIYRDYDTNDQPPAPSLQAPAGVEASFSGWKQVARLRHRDGMPARWRGYVRLHADAGALESGAAVEVSVGSDESVRVPLSPPGA